MHFSVLITISVRMRTRVTVASLSACPAYPGFSKRGGALGVCARAEIYVTTPIFKPRPLRLRVYDHDRLLPSCSIILGTSIVQRFFFLEKR